MTASKRPRPASFSVGIAMLRESTTGTACHRAGYSSPMRRALMVTAPGCWMRESRVDGVVAGVARQLHHHPARSVPRTRQFHDTSRRELAPHGVEGRLRILGLDGHLEHLLRHTAEAVEEREDHRREGVPTAAVGTKPRPQAMPTAMAEQQDHDVPRIAYGGAKADERAEAHETERTSQTVAYDDHHQGACHGEDGLGLGDLGGDAAEASADEPSPWTVSDEEAQQERGAEARRG